MGSAMATFVFTDLVGSTALGSSLGPDAAEALRVAHFGVLRAAIEAAGGSEVKNLGDGLMVMFTSPSRALSCAAAMQQGIERHNRRGGVPLSVRIGISAGEAFEEDGDYFGDPVVEAARLCGAAEGGQVLTTELLRAMVGRHATLEFCPVGALELKGLPDPVAAVEMLWEPDLTAGSIPLPGRLVGAAAESLFGFFGRTEELGVLETARKRAASEGGVRLVLISGEPGMGKTTLVAQAARVAHPEGVSVVLGHCEEGLAMPYQPWVGALSQLLEHTDAATLAELSPTRAAALARLVPERADRLATGGPTLSDPDSERFVLLEGIVELLGAASRESPLVLVLDDLHWVDAASLQTLRHVVSSSVPMRVLVVGMYRETDLARTHPLVALLADLHREPSVTRVALDGLGEAEILELMEAAAGHEIDEAGVALAHALRRETGGNPFFAGELLRELSASDAIFQDADGRWGLRGELDGLRLPGSVRETVGRRVTRLGEETVRVLSVASVIGRDFDVDLLARVAHIGEDPLLDLLEEAAGAALVVESEDDLGSYRFVHALIQHTLYQDLGATRRQRMHQRVAETLEELSGAGDERVAELAHHWVEGTRPAELERAIHYSHRAGDVALRTLAPLDAIRWYTQALELCARLAQSDEAQRCSLLIGLGTAQRQAGDATHRATLLEAAAIAQTRGDGEALVRAALANTRMWWSSTGEVDHERVAVLEAALAAVPDTDLLARARLLATLAKELVYLGEIDRRRALCDEALQVARAERDPVTLLEVLLDRWWALWAPETFADRQDAAREALDLAETVSDPVLTFRAIGNELNASLERGDRDSYDRCQALADSLAAELGQPTLVWDAGLNRSTGVLLAGHAEDAERTTTETLELGIATGQPDAFEFYGAQLLEIRRAQGRLDEMVDLVAQLVEEDPNIPAFRSALTNVYCSLGREDDARRLVEGDVIAAYAAAPRDSTWTPAMALYAESAAKLGLSGPAKTLYDALLPFREQMAFSGVTLHGPLSHYLALLAAALGEDALAEEHLAEAMNAHEQLRSPYFLAVTELAWAEFLLAHDRPGDRNHASAMLDHALATAREYGFAAIELGAQQLADRLLTT